MRKLIICVLATLAVFAGGAAFGVATQSTPSTTGSPVTSVKGSIYKGFAEKHANGITHNLPPLKVAYRKCKFESQRILSPHYRLTWLNRCVGGVKSGYHQEAVLRDSLNYAHEHADDPTPPPTFPPYPTCNPPAGVSC